MAVAKKAKKNDPDEMLHRYELLFEQLTRFTTSITEHEKEINEARVVVEEAKAKFEEAKDNLRELENIRDSAKHSLYRFLSPKNGEILPLFDQMEDASEEKHGKNSDEWRKEPIASLGVSLPALNSLTDSDIVMVGQLQDRVLADPTGWFSAIVGITTGMAAAIVDKLNSFIFDRTSGK